MKICQFFEWFIAGNFVFLSLCSKTCVWKKMPQKYFRYWFFHSIPRFILIRIWKLPELLYKSNRKFAQRLKRWKLGRKNLQFSYLNPKPNEKRPKSLHYFNLIRNIYFLCVFIGFVGFPQNTFLPLLSLNNKRNFLVVLGVYLVQMKVVVFKHYINGE